MLFNDEKQLLEFAEAVAKPGWVTGPAGSGKTTFMALLNAFGFKSVDLDWYGGRVRFRKSPSRLNWEKYVNKENESIFYYFATFSQYNIPLGLLVTWVQGKITAAQVLDLNNDWKTASTWQDNCRPVQVDDQEVFQIINSELFARLNLGVVFKGDLWVIDTNHPDLHQPLDFFAGTCSNELDVAGDLRPKTIIMVKPRYEQRVNALRLRSQDPHNTDPTRWKQQAEMSRSAFERYYSDWEEKLRLIAFYIKAPLFVVTPPHLDLPSEGWLSRQTYEIIKSRLGKLRTRKSRG